MVDLYRLTDVFSETLIEVRRDLAIAPYVPVVGDVVFVDEDPVAKLETVVVTVDGFMVGTDRKFFALIGSLIGIGKP